VNFTPEEVEEKVRKIPFVEETTTLNTPPKSVKGRSTKVKSHKILLIAAIISILIAIFAVSSIAFDWNIFDELKNRFGTVADVPINQELDANGITVVSRGDFFTYDSLEEALKSQHINILYPIKLPDDTTLEKLMLYQIDSINEIIFVFSNTNLSFSVSIQQSVPEWVLVDATEIMIIENLDCYIIDMNDVNVVQMFFEYKDNLYEINYTNKQELIEIIENLKELD